MTLATSKKSRPLTIPTISKDRAFKLNEDILELGEKMGTHLCEMRDTAGYRHLGYWDFASYCKNEFGHSKSRAYQLIEEAQIEAEIRQESKILESRKIPGSQLRILGKNVARADRVKVLEYAYRLAEEEQRKPTADDLKAAAITINGGIPNKQGKWTKPLAKIGYEKGVEVIANSQLPTRAEGVIKKIREDGRADVYISRYNTTITYSFEDLELATPRTHKPLKQDECALDQEVRVFSSRMHISGEVGTIVGRLKETAFVKIDARTEELRYDELAAIEEEQSEEKASEAIVDISSSTLEGDSFEWGKWTQKYLSQLTTWLAKYATDQQRRDIFSALAEGLSPEAKEAAIAIFGGTTHPPILEKIDAGDNLKSEPPAAGKRQDVTLVTPRIKLVEQPTATETLGNLNQQIAALEDNIIAEKQRLEANLASATKQAERKKIKKDLAHQNERLSHLKTFSGLKIGATVNRHRSTEKGVIKQLDFSVGGMPQVWVNWEESAITKAECVAIIEPSVNVEDIELDEIETSILAAISDNECVSKLTLKLRTGWSLIEIEEALTKLEQFGLVEDTDSRNVWRTTTKKKSLASPLPSGEF